MSLDNLTLVSVVDSTIMIGVCVVFFMAFLLTVNVVISSFREVYE